MFGAWTVALNKYCSLTALLLKASRSQRSSSATLLPVHPEYLFGMSNTQSEGKKLKLVKKAQHSTIIDHVYLFKERIPLFVFSIDGPKQNATSLLTPVSNIVFYALSSGTLGFALHGSFNNHLHERIRLAVEEPPPI